MKLTRLRYSSQISETRHRYTTCRETALNVRAPRSRSQAGRLRAANANVGATEQRFSNCFERMCAHTSRIRRRQFDLRRLSATASCKTAAQDAHTSGTLPLLWLELSPSGEWHYHSRQLHVMLHELCPRSEPPIPRRLHMHSRKSDAQHGELWWERRTSEGNRRAAHVALNRLVNVERLIHQGATVFAEDGANRWLCALHVASVRRCSRLAAPSRRRRPTDSVELRTTRVSATKSPYY